MTVAQNFGMEDTQNHWHGPDTEEIAHSQGHSLAIPTWIHRSKMAIAESVFHPFKSGNELTSTRKETPLKAVQVEGLVMRFALQLHITC